MTATILLLFALITAHAYPSCSEQDCGQKPTTPDAPCPDGISHSGVGPCQRNNNGSCQWSILTCPTSCDNVACKYNGVCNVGANNLATCKCNRPCPLIERPECGTDGVTYPNDCSLEVAICNSEGRIQLAHCGKCTQTTSSCNPCPVHYRCNSAGSACVRLSQVNEPCNPSLGPNIDGSNCEGPLTCVVNSNLIGASGRCQQPATGPCNPCPAHYRCNSAGNACVRLSQLNETCNPSLGPNIAGSNCEDPLTCVVNSNLIGASGRCQQSAPAAVGPCNPCPTHSRCNSAGNACVRLSQVNEACNPSLGPNINGSNCEDPLTCVVNSNLPGASGRCQQQAADCSNFPCRWNSTCQMVDGNPTCVCPDNCTHEPYPQCATDGNTYYNPCELEKQYCKTQGQVKYSFLGMCRQYGTCPPGLTTFNCSVPPCQVAHCPAQQPGTWYCTNNPCGGCSAEYHNMLTNARLNCTGQCPPGQKPVQCFDDPCANFNCNSNYECIADYCGGCNCRCYLGPYPAACEPK